MRDRFYFPDPQCMCIPCYINRARARWNGFSDWHKFVVVMANVGGAVGLFITAVLLNGGFTK